MDTNQRIDIILAKLNGVNQNGTSKKTPWKPVDGFHTLLALKDTDGGQTVNLNKGVTVKVFINTRTGEVRTFIEDAAK